MTDLTSAAQSYFGNRFDGVIRIETEDGATMWVDGRATPPKIGTDAPANLDGAYCLWRASADTLGRVFGPEQRQLEAAYIAGRLEISGDMAVMARLGNAQGVAS